MDVSFYGGSMSLNREIHYLVNKHLYRDAEGKEEVVFDLVKREGFSTAR